MSTNPFDDAGGGGGAVPGGAPSSMHHYQQQHHQQQQQHARYYARQQHQQQLQQPPLPPSSSSSAAAHHQYYARGGDAAAASHYPPNKSSTPPPRSLSSSLQQQQQQQQQQPSPIFSARGVEWPLPSSFNPTQYRKWRRECKSVGVTLGILSSGLRLQNVIPGGGSSSNTDDYYSGGVGGGDTAGGGVATTTGGGGVGGRSAFASSSITGADGDYNSIGGGSSLESNNAAAAAANTASSGGGGGAAATTTNSGGGYGGLTGLMGRVLGASSPSASGLAAGGALTNDIEEEDLNISATRPIFPPRAKCVAASNGWIVAVVECGHAPTASSSPSTNVVAASLSAAGAGGNNSSGGGSTPMMMQSKHALTALIPPLRLVSRWNVRRGTSLMGSEGNHLVPLPPPVRTAATTTEEFSSMMTPSKSSATMMLSSGNNNNNSNDPNFGRIAHTFVDPTGCHVLLSSKNGEAYYLHSTSKKVRKLAGFGPNVDGTFSGYRAGMSLGDVVSGNNGNVSGGGGETVVQTGLTPGSYVTAVGWDRDRGTEGSTKRILLGTSNGELYEYALLSPNAASPGKVKSSPFDTKAGELGGATMDEYGEGNDPIDAPVLLRRLYASSNSRGGAEGGAVGGILFQRILTGGGAAGAGGGSSAAGGHVIVLISTGGMHRHTRLHTFRSEPSSLALRSAFSCPPNNKVVGKKGSSSFVELPGSVEFAELKSCNDGFALRTETGIYYGTMERMATAASMMSSSSGIGLNAAAAGGGSSGGGIVDAGMLNYDSLQGNTATGNQRRDSMVMTPASIGLTPHHFITLSSSANDVRFVNRVAKKVIQEERVDWVSVSQSSSSAVDHGDLHGGGGPRWGAGAAAELLTDVRRPDQIWLRKGRSLVHISSSCEDRDVWKFVLERSIETVAPLPHYNNFASLSAGGATDDAGNSTNATLMTSEEKHIDGQFEHAKSLCSNSSQKAVVTAVRAEYHLSQGRVELAAKYMAQCPPTVMPFADTAVRLTLPMLGGGDNEALLSQHNNSSKANEALASSNMALITFLCDKMKIAAKSKKDSVVCTMLGTWLTELHLQERERDGGSSSGKPIYLRQSHRHVQSVNRALLHQFLSSYVREMDPKTIISVLASHDISAGECAGYSAAAGDIGAAVNAALSGEDEKNGALDALRVLNDSPIEKAEPYYYKYALTLLSRAPISAAKSFVARYSDGLSDTKLLPAFMHYEQRRKNRRDTSSSSTAPSATFSATFVDDGNAATRYMEGVIKLGSQSRAIYNYLTSLYASMEDEGPLFRFLSTHVPPATISTSSVGTGGGVGDLLLKQANEEKKSPLDKSFALRTILRTGRHFRSAVKLYMGFGMRQQAVELALKVDPSLARELARQSDDKDETKRLWLMIARNAAANNGTSTRDGKDVVARVVMVLKDCGPDILSIEDVLPFLPDFAQIDEFKDEICSALASYSSKIEHYLKEMNECDQTCDALRDELSRLKAVGTKIRDDARCAFTNKYVLEEGEPFYAFPSGYVVLESALKQEVIPHLNEKQLRRVKFIENELARLRRSRASIGRSSYEVARDDYEMEELQVELNGLIAAECPLTGSVMVDSIDHGFSGDEDDEFP